MLEAHGGIESWGKVQLLKIDLDIGGNLLLTKCKSPRLRNLHCSVFANEIKTVIENYPKSGLWGIFQNDHVEIVDDVGSSVGGRKVVREKLTQKKIWDDLDLLYFLGYAIWNYASTPFLLCFHGVEAKEISSWRSQQGQTFRRLRVRFPASIPTHCSTQIFYFDDKYMQTRLDYTAEIFGSWAKGAHICKAHRSFDGFIFPTERKVLGNWLTRSPLPFPPAMQGRVRDIDIIFE